MNTQKRFTVRARKDGALIYRGNDVTLALCLAQPYLSAHWEFNSPQAEKEYTEAKAKYRKSI